MGPNFGWKGQMDFCKKNYPKLDEEKCGIIARYRYHNLMRRATFEFAIDKMFTINKEDTLQAVHPLDGTDLLGSEDFTLGFSLVFGEEDYMLSIDDEQSKKLVEAKNRKDC